MLLLRSDGLQKENLIHEIEDQADSFLNDLLAEYQRLLVQEIETTRKEKIAAVIDRCRHILVGYYAVKQLSFIFEKKSKILTIGIETIERMLHDHLEKKAIQFEMCEEVFKIEVSARHLSMEARCSINEDEKSTKPLEQLETASAKIDELDERGMKEGMLSKAKDKKSTISATSEMAKALNEMMNTHMKRVIESKRYEAQQEEDQGSEDEMENEKQDQRGIQSQSYVSIPEQAMARLAVAQRHQEELSEEKSNIMKDLIVEVSTIAAAAMSQLIVKLNLEKKDAQQFKRIIEEWKVETFEKRMKPAYLKKPEAGHCHQDEENSQYLQWDEQKTVLQRNAEALATLRKELGAAAKIQSKGLSIKEISSQPDLLRENTDEQETSSQKDSDESLENEEIICRFSDVKLAHITQECMKFYKKKMKDERQKISIEADTTDGEQTVYETILNQTMLKFVKEARPFKEGFFELFKYKMIFLEEIIEAQFRDSRKGNLFGPINAYLSSMVEDWVDVYRNFFNSKRVVEGLYGVREILTYARKNLIFLCHELKMKFIETVSPSIDLNEGLLTRLFDNYVEASGLELQSVEDQFVNNVSYCCNLNGLPMLELSCCTNFKLTAENEETRRETSTSQMDQSLEIPGQPILLYEAQANSPKNKQEMLEQVEILDALRTRLLEKEIYEKKMELFSRKYDNLKTKELKEFAKKSQEVLKVVREPYPYTAINWTEKDVDLSEEKDIFDDFQDLVTWHLRAQIKEYLLAFTILGKLQTSLFEHWTILKEIEDSLKRFEAFKESIYTREILFESYLSIIPKETWLSLGKSTVSESLISNFIRNDLNGLAAFHDQELMYKGHNVKELTPEVNLVYNDSELLRFDQVIERLLLAKSAIQKLVEHQFKNHTTPKATTNPEMDLKSRYFQLRSPPKCICNCEPKCDSCNRLPSPFQGSEDVLCFETFSCNPDEEVNNLKMYLEFCRLFDEQLTSRKRLFKQNYWPLSLDKLQAKQCYLFGYIPYLRGNPSSKCLGQELSKLILLDDPRNYESTEEIPCFDEEFRFFFVKSEDLTKYLQQFKNQVSLLAVDLKLCVWEIEDRPTIQID